MLYCLNSCYLLPFFLETEPSPDPVQSSVTYALTPLLISPLLADERCKYRILSLMIIFQDNSTGSLLLPPLLHKCLSSGRRRSLSLAASRSQLQLSWKGNLLGPSRAKVPSVLGLTMVRDSGVTEC